jgi:hypothetical protein
MIKTYQRIVLSLCMVAGFGVNGMNQFQPMVEYQSMTPDEYKALEDIYARMQNTWSPEEYSSFRNLIQKDKETCLVQQQLAMNVAILKKDNDILGQGIQSLLKTYPDLAGDEKDLHGKSTGSDREQNKILKNQQKRIPSVPFTLGEVKFPTQSTIEFIKSHSGHCKRIMGMFGITLCIGLFLGYNAGSR